MPTASEYTPQSQKPVECNADVKLTMTRTKAIALYSFLEQQYIVGTLNPQRSLNEQYVNEIRLRLADEISR